MPVATKEQMLAQLDGAVKTSISSWQDIFDMLSSSYRLAGTSPLMLSVSYIWHRAFARAMELLPEEGDAQNIAYKMNRVVVEELMVEPDQADAERAISSILSALQAAVDAATAEEGPQTPETPGTKRVLH